MLPAETTKEENGELVCLLPAYILDVDRAGEAIHGAEENPGPSAGTGGVGAARAIPRQLEAQGVCQSIWMS